MSRCGRVVGNPGNHHDQLFNAGTDRANEQERTIPPLCTNYTIMMLCSPTTLSPPFSLFHCIIQGFPSPLVEPIQPIVQVGLAISVRTNKQKTGNFRLLPLTSANHKHRHKAHRRRWLCFTTEQSLAVRTQNTKYDRDRSRHYCGCYYTTAYCTTGLE